MNHHFVNSPVFGTWAAVPISTTWCQCLVLGCIWWLKQSWVELQVFEMKLIGNFLKLMLISVCLEEMLSLSDDIGQCCRDICRFHLVKCQDYDIIICRLTLRCEKRSELTGWWFSVFLPSDWTVTIEGARLTSWSPSASVMAASWTTGRTGPTTRCLCTYRSRSWCWTRAIMAPNSTG